ncbi:hypothetical protein P8C59_007874 [Phyllachora maydis]|uniref:Tubulin-specific chaperone A n=1 Tax=Phyllachora maydis TaxID=1825666 RepID=A0AAD9I9X5_9PEZI|nr:hypothetical protein P8C59_007874 [Phyllachora maydis]
MTPPSPLAINTQVVKRLLKEESSYHKELAGQQVRVKKLEDEFQAQNPDLDQNAEFLLKQERAALDETKAVFGPLRQRIASAVQKLEEQMAISESDGGAAAGELKEAKEALEEGQRAVASEHD